MKILAFKSAKFMSKKATGSNAIFEFPSQKREKATPTHSKKSRIGNSVFHDSY